MGLRHTRSDAELLPATQADPAAFGRFYARYERAVLAFFGSRTRDAERAADLTAEVFASVLEASDRFDAGRSPNHTAAPWLFAIARTTLATVLRRRTVAAQPRSPTGAVLPRRSC